MKKTMTTAMITALFTSLCACAMDTEEDEYIDEDETSEVASELTGTVTCTGLGAGSCTASSLPTTWTIQQGPGNEGIVTSGLTVNWFCFGATGNRLVTAVGVGTATVKCSPR